MLTFDKRGGLSWENMKIEKILWGQTTVICEHRAAQVLRSNCWLLGTELWYFQAETKSRETTIGAASVPIEIGVLWELEF